MNRSLTFNDSSQHYRSSSFFKELYWKLNLLPFIQNLYYLYKNYDKDCIYFIKNVRFQNKIFCIYALIAYRNSNFKFFNGILWYIKLYKPSFISINYSSKIVKFETQIPTKKLVNQHLLQQIFFYFNQTGWIVHFSAFIFC